MSVRTYLRNLANALDTRNPCGTHTEIILPQIFSQRVLLTVLSVSVAIVGNIQKFPTLLLFKGCSVRSGHICLFAVEGGGRGGKSTGEKCGGGRGGSFLGIKEGHRSVGGVLTFFRMNGEFKFFVHASQLGLILNPTSQ